MENFVKKILEKQFPSRKNEKQIMCFTDLGLPSGTLWATYDVEEPIVEGCTLPSYEQAQELIEHCEFYVMEESDGTRYMTARGPNGQTIRFPMKDYEGTPGSSGCCWCAGAPSEDFGYFMLLSEYTITIGVGQRDLEFPYRMVRV